VPKVCPPPSSSWARIMQPEHRTMACKRRLPEIRGASCEAPAAAAVEDAVEDAAQLLATRKNCKSKEQESCARFPFLPDHGQERRRVRYMACWFAALTMNLPINQGRPVLLRVAPQTNPTLRTAKSLPVQEVCICCVGGPTGCACCPVQCMLSCCTAVGGKAAQLPPAVTRQRTAPRPTLSDRRLAPSVS
jgi:hypothetical protein